MRHTILYIVFFLSSIMGIQAAPADTIATSVADSAINTSQVTATNSAEADELTLDDIDTDQDKGLYVSLKTKFIEGGAGFMSIVALSLVLGLAFCIERIIYLHMAQTDTRKLIADMDEKISNGRIDEALTQVQNTPGPVASIMAQALIRIDDSIDSIERAVKSYGTVQAANLEKGCSWITLFIAMAPSLGFLGTVIGMVMSFDNIQAAGDIGPTIVAAGMKVALITTIFGIIVALILQLFYNFILSRIEALTLEMEDASISLLDIISRRKATMDSASAVKE